MFESKYSKVLTVILIIVIIAILGLLGFLAYDYFQQYNTTKDASEFVDNYQGEKVGTDGDNGNGNGTENGSNDEENSTSASDILDQLNTTSSSGTSTSSTAKKKQYKGFNVVGTMEIPKINLNYPILEDMSKKALETSIVALYPPKGTTLNQPGNTVIVGHNYRNGLFFSNNKKLENGDKIYVTDYTGKKLTYTIYNKFEANQNDTSFYQRDTAGKAELTLSTCTDASNDMRLIIFAKQD